MPALWSLGFQQCKWSYFPETQVREITSKMRQLEIPCDAIYLDIDYMDGFRCFTWDDDRFPNPKKMVSELAEEGIHLFSTLVLTIELVEMVASQVESCGDPRCPLHGPAMMN